MVVTIMRLTAVFGENGVQTARTVWGAVQVIVATFVANAPTIYGDVRVVWSKRKEAEKRRTTRSESWTGNMSRSLDVDVDGTGDIEGAGESEKGKSGKGSSGKDDMESLREVRCVTPTISDVEPNSTNKDALEADGISPRTTLQ